MSKFEDWSNHDGFNKWRISAGMVQLRKIEAAWEGYKAGVATAVQADEYNRSTVPVDHAYLRELENHVERADRILKVAGEVYDEFQKKIAHADNGAQLLEALHRLHVELHK